ncbi:alpha-d-galacturonidase [Niabella ginsengisoli]|uniref:Glycoside hydrolase family 20 zincin-like fold domain-containing protein n=1 Tax=Niabella ginsengisoli TaxID=522298 RepID=A0ABS9SK54_9BACT|nr:glycoside hydrolase family 20 zincin-like fold domain-containing protein [Niabella ginsengisoli]MCH5598764.1 glycoside hydrolase family 20 zincin-like fold domain-containing protein [Niabella ginsengisoli]
MMRLTWLLVFGILANTSFATVIRKVIIVNQLPNQPRVEYGIDALKNKLQSIGYAVDVVTKANTPYKNQQLIVINKNFRKDLKKEGFSIRAEKNTINITGADPSGLLYGCLELADIAVNNRSIPENINVKDAPEMVLRGECIGLQKPYYLPGRTVYEYPYTEETFPWFYDKKLWLQVLDSMAVNKMNSLYLWNGHPFASLVKLKEYPYAVEVDDATFAKNEDIYRFLTTEADKRGIWVIQMFYNIIVSKPFAEKHGLKTQDRERPIIPVIADYTKKSITEFVRKYPNVGLLVCLGEAMEGVGKDDIEWFTKTIIPGVQDGMKAAGLKAEPPIVLRAHDTDAPAVMKASLPLYKNLYTMAKFNGEALTYQTPRGKWAELHQTLSKQGNIHIENVHILANLEPFRYGSPRFIQESIVGMHEAMGGNGLHLYPQASYWDWPYSADSIKGGERLLQIERDWLWYKTWSRYAWQSKRNRTEEVAYWSKILGNEFGANNTDGAHILKAYEEIGEIAPKLLRRFGITDGNRQTLTLGMLMTQLINPYRYGLFTLLYEAESPVGESLAEYAEKEWNAVQHIGETPVQIISEVKEHGDKAVAAINDVKSVVKNTEEFDRIKNDIFSYQAMSYHYAFKTEAALAILRYKYSNDIKDLDKALPLFQQSVDWYKKLTDLTKGTYLYANSMQTGARKIPLSGSGGRYKNWSDVLPVFEEELSTFQRKVDSLKHLKPGALENVTPLKNAVVKIVGNFQYYNIDSLSQPFSDKPYTIRSFAGELKDLRGLKTSFKDQIANGTEISFSNKKRVKVLVGFFKPQKAAFSVDTVYLKQPELETNATANEYGQADTKIANAMIIPGMPQLHVHSYEFAPGQNTLKLAKGVALILGFVDADAPLRVYDAGLYESGNRKQVDWLFE